MLALEKSIESQPFTVAPGAHLLIFRVVRLVWFSFLARIETGLSGGKQGDKSYKLLIVCGQRFRLLFILRTNVQRHRIPNYPYSQIGSELQKKMLELVIY